MGLPPRPVCRAGSQEGVALILTALILVSLMFSKPSIVLRGWNTFDKLWEGQGAD